MLVQILLMIQGAHRMCAKKLKKLKQEWKGFNGKTVYLTPDILLEKYLVLAICLPDRVYFWTITLCNFYFTARTSEVLDKMVSDKFLMPQLQLLTSKETQLNALQFVREAAYLSYKKLQEDNDRMSKRIESIMRKSRGSVSFTHAKHTNTTNNPHINSITYFHQPSQAERTITQY